METAGILALVSGFFHASWNLLAKRMGGGRSATLAILTGDLVVMSLVIPFVAHRMTWAALPYVALAAVGEALYVTSLGIALAKGDLGITYGVSRGVALLAVWPAGYIVFGDIPSYAAWIATALLIVGMILCQPRASDARQSKLALGWTVATGLSVGLYHTAYKGAVNAGADAITTFAGSVAIAVPLLWVVSGKSIRQQTLQVFRTHPRVTAAASVLSAASFVLAVIALSMTQSGRVLGLRNASVGFAGLFAYLAGERPVGRQWGGLGILFAGVLILAIFS